MSKDKCYAIMPLTCKNSGKMYGPTHPKYATSAHWVAFKLLAFTFCSFAECSKSTCTT